MSAHKLLTSEAFAAVSGWVVPKVGLIIDLWKQIATGQNLSKNAVFGDMLEIGVHHGRLFLAMENLVPVEHKCYAVDLFGQQHLNIDQSGRGSYRKFTGYCEQFAEFPDRIVPVAGDSFSIQSLPVSHDYGLISVDGGHTREHAFF